MRFLAGFLLGVVATLWYSRSRGELHIDQRFGEMQERANAVLTESRRILEETRKELSSALEAGRQSVQQTTDKLRTGPGEGGDPTGMSS